LKKIIIWAILSVLLLAVVLSASCSSSTTAAGPTVLTVTSGSTVKAYSMAELQKLKSTTGNGGTKNKTGAVAGPFSYQGVALKDLINAVGGVKSGQSVKLTGSDGYSKTLSFDQVTSGGFNTYDISGNPVTPKENPVLVVVYSSKGAALDSTVGPLEVGLLYSENLITDGSNWVKLLAKIDIVAAQ
jgi:hypothetical protein